jgi:hypothetical protein
MSDFIFISFSSTTYIYGHTHTHTHTQCYAYYLIRQVTESQQPVTTLLDFSNEVFENVNL